uniref:Leukocyte cell-derived chemotaxin 1 n=1 Tax=Oncorhynchus tshawytscha TaxID=74940 RepID=A0A8C8HTE4_ONCTS
WSWTGKKVKTRFCPIGEKDQGVTYSSSAAKPPVAVGRLLRFGVAALVVGAVLMLCGSIGAFHLWKVSDKNVEEGRNDEALEIHDFHTGITGIQLSGGEKHYIKSQIKALQRSRHSTRMKFDENSLTWVAADRPLKNSSFLSTKILDLCGDLPIFWLQTTYSKGPSLMAPAIHMEGAMTFDPILDHQGIFCSECRHSYTHYILPCRWWVACILGVVSVVHAHFLKPNSPKVLKVMFCKQQCHLYADIYCRTLYLVANTG